MARPVVPPPPPGRTGTLGPAGVELVSVDSMAVYRGMDIGTAKPTPEIRARLPYHLLDLVEPSEEFTVQQFQRAARQALAGIAARGNAALLVGGHRPLPAVGGGRPVVPGSVPRGGRPAVRPDRRGGRRGGVPPSGPCWPTSTGSSSSSTRWPPAGVDPANRRRLVRALEVTLGSGRPFSEFGPGLERYPPSPVLMVGIDRPPDELDRRIAERFEGLMDRGLLDEVATLAARPGGLSRTARQALGYRELLAHLEEGVPLEAARWPWPCSGPGPSPAGSGRGSAAIPVSCGWTRPTIRPGPSPPWWGATPGRPRGWENGPAPDDAHRPDLPAPLADQAPRCRERLPGPDRPGRPVGTDRGGGPGPVRPPLRDRGPTG